MTKQLPGITDEILLCMDNEHDPDHKLLLLHSDKGEGEFIVAHYSVRQKSRYQGSYFMCRDSKMAALLAALKELCRVADLYYVAGKPTEVEV